MRRRTHYILFGITLVFAAICGVLMLHVNVNADMTKYLPDDSQMKRGLEIVMSEFGSSAQMSGTDVHVMFEGLSPKEVPGITTLLEAYPDVHSVTYRNSADSTHTVFDLDVPKSVDQKALGKQISNRFGGNCVVETSQDGATPPVSVMIFAAVLIMVVLFLMAQSWFEPVVILLSALVAIVLNMGTNALLPSVSITTNFIGSILQAVLSLDYSIVLLNRYRQEQNEHTDRVTAGIAANAAIRRAAPSVLSSALTTVVGLLMLCFMRLKIGADMGIVLAKGVVCSLICTFTVMPSLMLLFRRTINKTAKRAYVPSMAGLSRFVTSHKITVALFAVVLFFVSWYFSRKTTIFFSAEQESKIEKIFPSPNPFVLVYDTRDEGYITELADSLMQQPGVQAVISYPTLLSEPLTPAEMVDHIHSMTTLFADRMPEGTNVSPEDMAMLRPELVQIIYYMRAVEPENPTLTFPELARFLHTHVARNPLFSSMIDREAREQIEMLNSLLDVPAEEPKPAPVKHLKDTVPVEPEDTTPIVRDTTPVPMLAGHVSPVSTDSLAVPEIDVDRIAIVPFISRLYTKQPTPLTLEMRSLTDTITIRMPMSVNEMAAFIGSTPTQTRLVYGYAPKGTHKLTPLQYVHLLTDDLFRRPGLQGLISVEQRTMLEQRAYLMDLADQNASLTPGDLNKLISAFGVTGYTNEQLLSIAYPSQKQTRNKKHSSDTVVSVAPLVLPVPEAANLSSLNSPSSTLNAPDTVPAEPVVPEAPKRVAPRMSKADQQAELFTELVFGGKSYTAEQMAAKLQRLMKLSDVKNKAFDPAYLPLLYAYYGSEHSRCSRMKMGLGEVLTYLCDTLIYDKRLETLISDSVRTQVSDVRTQVIDGVAQLRQPDHSLLVVLSSLPKESPETYAFVDTLTALAEARLEGEHYYVGESVMYAEMRGGFDHEMNVVTLLTILAIFLIVAITFRSVIVPTILVVTVMTAVFVNVVVAGLVTGQMLYLAYLIVQAILMGATIDYGILFANYYREKRKTMTQIDAITEAYQSSIRTILTSGLIMVVGPGAMAVAIDDVMISNIVGCLAVGAFVAVVLTLTLVPAVLVALDRLVVYGKKNRYVDTPESAEPDAK